MTAIVYLRENILGSYPSTGRNASAPPSLFPCSLCNIHLFPTDSCKQIGSPQIFPIYKGLGVIERDSWHTQRTQQCTEFVCRIISCVFIQPLTPQYCAGQPLYTPYFSPRTFQFKDGLNFQRSSVKPMLQIWVE